MKLLFLYVDEYHCLKNAQMNFAEDPRFEYKNGEICESEESKNYKFESVSLFKSPVDNISAIVGSNGSGKTSILKIFEEIFVSNDGFFLQ